MRKIAYITLCLALFCVSVTAWCWAGGGAGTEGASFLDIPVGSVPASLGSAYTARATDAYAPVWNPAGLAFNDAPRLSGTHVSYLAGIHYDYVGFAMPMKDRGFGAAIQNLGSGNIVRANAGGTITGGFEATFTAYSLAYGQQLSPKLSLGITGKMISESIDDTSAKSYAADLGLMYKVTDKINFGSALANLGPNIKFVDEGDPLPTAWRNGVFAQIFDDVDVSGEFVYRRIGRASFKAGVQGRYAKVLFLRMGLDTEHVKGLSGLSAITGGLGIHAYGQEFAYAWVPYSDLGSTHYFSLDFRFGGGKEKQVTGIIQVDTDDDELPHQTQQKQQKQQAQPKKSGKAAAAGAAAPAPREREPEISNDYELLNQLLNDTEKRSLRKNPDVPEPGENK